MITTEFTLSTNDIQRLEPLLANRGNRNGSFSHAHLAALSEKLTICREISPPDVPADVVTMNSLVRLQELDSGKTMDYTLVFPGNANAQENRISVLTPFGAALIGARVGNHIEVKTPTMVRKLVIRDLLFQPESAGRHEL